MSDSPGGVGFQSCTSCALLPARLIASRRIRAPRARFRSRRLFGYREILEGQKHVLDKMKELWSYLSSSFAGSGNVLKAVNRAQTIESYQRATKTIFDTGIWRA